VAVNGQESGGAGSWSTSDRGRKADGRLKENPWDVDAWGVLVREAQNLPIDTVRGFFEKLVNQFPTCGKYWKTYIDMEMKFKHFDAVEKLFQRCLIKVLHMDLWKTYLSYVKETKQTLSSFREKMVQAYEFALEKIGHDYSSYPIWCEYINFLKAGEAAGAYAENQKISQIRKVYSRAVLTPIYNIELLWKEYQQFETSINKMLAEKLIHEKTREYQIARKATKDCETATNGLNRSLPATPPTGSPYEHNQKETWKKYVAWEKTNPLKADDQNVVVKRVMFAFEQCLLCYGFHPDVWYEAAAFLEDKSRELMERGDMQGGQKLAEEAVALYERCTASHLKANCLLHFAYADFEESRKRYQKVHAIYEKLLREDINPTLVYCQYMRFSRRAEGVKECREVFRKARNDTRSQYHVFVCAALIEHYCNKDPKVATNIFELGLKKYADLPEFVLKYVEYKIAQNEDNNTRVLFERLLSLITKEKSTPILGRYMEFESQYGDLSSILKIDRRIAQTYTQMERPDERDPTLLIDRYKYDDLLPCSTNELRSMGYDPSSLKTSEAFTVTPVAETSVTEVKKELPKPDILHMKPFKPMANISGRIGSNIAPGGVFPPPPAVADLLLMLPPPTSFRGPFVHVDHIMRMMSDCNIDEYAPKAAISLTNGTSSSDGKGVKRAGDDDSDDESAYHPPVNDIYRARQQKRVHVL